MTASDSRRSVDDADLAPTNDAIWRALADPRRRAILAALREGPQTTTYLVQQFPSMTRFAVMKHITVLRDVGLVRTREEGPRRMNSLNVIPLRLVYDEIVDGYQDLWAGHLTGVKQHAEQLARPSRPEDRRDASGSGGQ